jgi:O-antigen ligase
MQRFHFPRQFRWEMYAVGLIIVLLFVGFLTNRVISNVGMLLAGIYALTQTKRWLGLRSQPLMWAILAICLVPLLSDLWIAGTHFYRHRGVMKWILVLFPCFLFAMPPGRLTVRLVHIVFLVAMAISTAYSCWHYIADFGAMAARYKVSKVMPTLALADHIRIGWLTVLSCVVAFYEGKMTTNKVWRRWTWLYIFVQCAFVHLLGAKTGLITLYLTILVLAAFALPGGRKWLISVVVLLVMVMPVASYYTIPSLRERFHFIKYDFEHAVRGEYREGLSDAVRLYSLQAGWDIVKAHPNTGVGFSRLQDECNAWYKQHIPDLKADNYFLPSSQILIYWASGGWLGLACILAYLVLPFVISVLRCNRWWLAFYLPALLTMLYETHLEGQLPLFAWSFFFAWFWRLATDEKAGQRVIGFNKLEKV